MSKVITVVYEDGVFKPITPPNIPEHKKITLIIEEETEKPSDILELACNVYAGLSPEDINDVEKIAFDRRHFSRD